MKDQGPHLGRALGVVGMSPACSPCHWPTRFGDAEDKSKRKKESSMKVEGVRVLGVCGCVDVCLCMCVWSIEILNFYPGTKCTAKTRYQSKRAPLSTITYLSSTMVDILGNQTEDDT